MTGSGGLISINMLYHNNYLVIDQPGACVVRLASDCLKCLLIPHAVQRPAGMASARHARLDVSLTMAYQYHASFAFLSRQNHYAVPVFSQCARQRQR